MSDFFDIVNGWVEETEKTLDDVLQTIVIMVGKSVITLSPVDTGLFRGNWQLTFTGTDGPITRLDQTGNATTAELVDRANSFTAGQVAYIQNHIHYGYDLEYGSSQRQAPHGMVRVTAARFNQIVKEALALHKS